YCAPFTEFPGWTDKPNVVNERGRGIMNYFVRTGEIVYDEATDLTWQHSGSKRLDDYQTKKYLTQLNADKHGGYSDWRLPTLEEAMSLMEAHPREAESLEDFSYLPPKPRKGFHIDPIFDPSPLAIWTSDLRSSGNFWIVDYFYGYCRYKMNRQYPSSVYVRAVR
ncbi:MAG TPA: DUF1566 domain-containing protein, partial [Longimicrobium sp.]